MKGAALAEWKRSTPVVRGQGKGP